MGSPRSLRRPPSRWNLLMLSLTALHMASTVSAIQLSKFQEINGFSAACTAAYNTEVPGCTSSDFAGKNPCSASCFSGLQTISQLINTACTGVSADPTTLIGLFFQGKGVAALCPAFISRVPDTGSSTAPPTAATTEQTTEARATSTTLIISSTSSLQQQTQTTESSSSVETSTSESSISMIAATFSKTAAAPTSGTSMVTANSNSNPATVASSTLQTTSPAAQSTSNPNSFGGDVDPFATKNSASQVPLERLTSICAALGILVTVWNI